jgi:hypothetical protein
MTHEEDEEFKALERRLKKRDEDDDIQEYVQPLDLNPYRNMVIEEVAKEIENFTFAFGVDTTQSFAAFVRSMKE